MLLPLEGTPCLCYFCAPTRWAEGIVTLTIRSGQEGISKEQFRAEIRPNRSMSPRGLAITVICLTVVCLTIALSFFSLGLWLVLPFAGLEIFAVGVAVGYTIHRSKDSEIILVDDKYVIVTRSEGSRISQDKFDRYWVRVSLESATTRLQPSRLKIGSHGRFIEIAKGATLEAREELAVHLKQVLQAVV